MSHIHHNLIQKLDALAEQDRQLADQLSQPEVLTNHEQVRSLSIKRAAMADLVEQYLVYRRMRDEIAEYEQVLADGSDRELAAMAQAELPGLKQQAQQLLDQLASELVTADDRTIASVMLEIRAGAGGAEAALWAGDVFEMYQRYAAEKRWQVEVLDFSPGDQGGIRQVIANVRGPGVWQALGYEGGVHCVKRVPATEAQGRVHTSTCTVAVLPEPEQVQINIPESDVKVNITTAQGPGGQNVNKVATAVHLLHVPTGIEVRMQETKSQHQNRQKAWQLLRARVYDFYQRQKDAQRAEQRAAMIGSGERSERIRTYRYKENIAVDHRLSQSFNLQTLLAGELDELMDALVAMDRARRLAAL